MDKQNTMDSQVNPSAVGGPWKESLCGCFNDMPTCCCGFWCLPCLYGINAEKIDGSNCVGSCLVYWLTSMFYLCWVPHMSKRKTLRLKYRLQEEPCNDCLVTAFCVGCSVCQEARELKTRDGPRGGSNVMPIRNQPKPAYRK